MKKINFLFVVLMVASLFVPVWADSYDIMTNYYTYYESHDSDYWFSDVAATDDGGYIAVGNIIVKYDSNHEVEWKKEGRYDEKVIVTSDGGYVMISGDIEEKHTNSTKLTVATEGYIDENDEDINYIVKYDNSGNKVWEKKIFTEDGNGNIESYYVLNDVIQIGGSYLVISTRLSYNDEYNIYFDAVSVLLSFDSDGNMSVINEWDNYVDALVINATNDNGYIIAGNEIIMKYDSDGLEEWSIDDLDYNVNDIKQTSDGGYIAVGDDYGDSCVVKYDSEGKEEWWKTDDNVIYKSIVTANNYYAIVGIEKDYTSDDYYIYDGLYKIYDEDGNVLDSNIYSGNDNIYFGDIDILNDGSYIIAGFLDASNLNEVELSGERDGLIINIVRPSKEVNYLIWIIVIAVIVILVLVYYNKKKKNKIR